MAGGEDINSCVGDLLRCVLGMVQNAWSNKLLAVISGVYSIRRWTVTGYGDKVDPTRTLQPPRSAPHKSPKLRKINLNFVAFTWHSQTPS